MHIAQCMAASSQDCSPLYHPRFQINWPTVNTNHVVKTNMHNNGVKTARQGAETVWLRGQSPTNTVFEDVVPQQATKCSSPGLCQGLPS